MTESVLPRNPQLLPFLYLINRLSLKAAALDSPEALIFTIVNDSRQVLPYDRAVLFSYDKGKAQVIGISGESEVNEASDLVKTWQRLANALISSDKLQELSNEAFRAESLPEWQAIQKDNPSAMFWLPIMTGKEQVLGLWLEQHGKEQFMLPAVELAAVLRDFLMPAYGLGWKRLHAGFSPKRLLGKKSSFILAAAVLLLAFVPVHLRIAAPCELLPKDPYVVRTPLKGVIERVLVNPGQRVSEGTPLFLYDHEQFEHALKAAAKEVQVRQSEIERIAVLSLGRPDAQNELRVLKLQKQKALIDLELAQHEAQQLTARAPSSGIALLEQPELWQGRAVEVGEKVLMIGDPEQTEIQIWIPEQDNIAFKQDKPIKIFLNVTPTMSRQATIRYVSNEAKLTEQGISSFVAKADWSGSQPDDVKLGLQGTAIIYGDRVPFIYYLLRKPIATLRRLLGV